MEPEGSILHLQMPATSHILSWVRNVVQVPHTPVPTSRWSILIQGVLKLAIQKSLVIISEQKVRICSATFQKQRLVLVLIPPARWQSTRAELLRWAICWHSSKVLPVIMIRITVRSAYGVVFVSWIAIAHFRSEKFQDKLSQKITAENEYFRVIQSIRWNWLCIFPEPTVTGISYLDMLEN